MTLPSTKTASVDGEELTETQVFSNTQTPEKASVNDVPVLRRDAMDCLARREHSFYELQQKLTKKFPDTDPELLHTIADKLRVEGLQSDARFAESYVRYRKSRGFAYLHIKADLSGRRVAEEVINQYLLVYETDWQSRADELVARKMRDQQALNYGSKLHRKLARFLESRGFAALQIRKALEKHLC